MFLVPFFSARCSYFTITITLKIKIKLKTKFPGENTCFLEQLVLHCSNLKLKQKCCLFFSLFTVHEAPLLKFSCSKFLGFYFWYLLVEFLYFGPKLHFIRIIFPEFERKEKQISENQRRRDKVDNKKNCYLCQFEKFYSCAFTPYFPWKSISELKNIFFCLILYF